MLWPPPIPGFGQHPPRNIPYLPEAFILAYADRHFDLDVALQHGDISAEEKESTMLEFYADYWGVDPDDSEGLVAAMRDFGRAYPEVLNTLPPERAFEVAREFEISRHLSHKHISVKTYAEAALAVNPNNIEARHTLAKTISDYEAILEIDPNDHRAMRDIGNKWAYDRPEEAIALLKKAIELGSTSAYGALGRAYERMGDYKTAWTHYYQHKKAHPHGHGLVISHMAAIVKGDPKWEPIRRTARVDVPEQGAYGAPSGGFETVNSTETPPVAPAALPADPNNPQETRDRDAAARAAAAASAKERQQQIQKEVREFIDWLERGYNGTSDTEDFLSRQMSEHLQGGSGENFSPARLIRAQETLGRYGFEEGLKRLATSDPEIADRIRREPPRPRGIRDISSRRRE